MKLRMKDDSIRLRLDRDEVDRVAKGDAVRSATRFASDPSAVLNYGVEIDGTVSDVLVRPVASGFTVVIPSGLAREWTETDRVGIEHRQPLSSGGILSVTIEKDFACLHQERSDENAAFPNPRSNQAFAE